MQRQWLDVMLAMEFVDPSPLMTGEVGGGGGDSGRPPSTGLKVKVNRLVASSHFESFIMGCIIANCAVMASTFWGEPQWWTTTQEVLNLSFTATFTAECGMKLYAFGPAQYFRDGASVPYTL